MKHFKLLAILLMSISCSTIKSDDTSSFKDFMKSVSEKLQKSTRSASDWAAYYSHVCAHNLSDWIEYYRCVGKDKAQVYTDFIVDEKDVSFKKLSHSEKKAIKDLNKFYKKMASASKEKQEVLIEKFSSRWKECQKIFNNIKKK
jgi:hypothetical protein